MYRDSTDPRSFYKSKRFHSQSKSGLYGDALTDTVVLTETLLMQLYPKATKSTHTIELFDSIFKQADNPQMFTRASCVEIQIRRKFVTYNVPKR